MKKKIVIKIFCVFALTFAATIYANISSAAEGDIDVKVTSTSNFARSTGIEVCGTAFHKNGLAPLLVTIEHYESYYTTITAPNGVWCQLIMRWTFTGEIKVTASTLSDPGKKGGSLHFALKPALAIEP